MKRVVCYEHSDGTFTRAGGNPGHEAGITLRPLVKLPKDPNACLLWQGALDAQGYGKKEFNGRTLLAHRWMWQTLFGPVPDGLVVSHCCDNRHCVNPWHLVAQTQADAVRAGIGTILTAGDVADMRERWDNGEFIEHLADRFGVSHGTVHGIVHKQKWLKPKPFKPRAPVAHTKSRQQPSLQARSS